MEHVIGHINDNWKFYGLVMFLLSCLLIFWLSKYFATKDELKSHKSENAKSLADHQLALDMHKEKFTQHQLEHYKLRDTVNAIDGHLKHLPTAKEAQQSREAMANLQGRLEGMEPLFKQILNNQNMLIENELRNAKNGEKN
jgi:hypothetical protein